MSAASAVAEPTVAQESPEGAAAVQATEPAPTRKRRTTASSSSEGAPEANPLSLFRDTEEGADDTSTLFDPRSEKIPQTEYAVIDHAEAMRILKLERYENQRPLGERDVEFFVELINTNRFVQNTTLERCRVRKENNRIAYTNGYHRLEAIVRSGKAQRFEIKTWDVEDADELALVYAITDRGRPRSTVEAMRPYLGTLSDMPTTFRHGLAAGIRVLISSFSRGSATTKHRLPDDTLAQSMLAWRHEMDSYINCVKKHDTGLGRRFQSSPVIAVGLMTFRFQPEKAQQFWYKVATGSGRSHDTGDRQCYKLLLGAKVESASVHTYARKIAFCWNLFFNDKTATYIPAFTKDTPILIDGTPYNGSRTLMYLPGRKVGEDLAVVKNGNWEPFSYDIKDYETEMTPEEVAEGVQTSEALAKMGKLGAPRMPGR